MVVSVTVMDVRAAVVEEMDAVIAVMVVDATVTAVMVVDVTVTAAKFTIQLLYRLNVDYVHFSNKM